MHSSKPGSSSLLADSYHHPTSSFLIAVMGLSSVLFGCAKGGSDDGLGGAGGATAFATNATVGNGTTTSTTSNTSTATTGLTGDPLTDSCTADCQKVDALSPQLSCLPTPNCVSDCVADGNGGACKTQFIALNQCAATSIDAAHCYCTTDTHILGCDLCPSQVAAYQNCVDMSTD